MRAMKGRSVIVLAGALTAGCGPNERVLVPQQKGHRGNAEPVQQPEVQAHTNGAKQDAGGGV